MIYKQVDNEIHVATKIILSNYEKTAFNMLKTLDKVSLPQLCKALRLNSVFTKQVINNLENKIYFFWVITETKRKNNNKGNNIFTYYSLKERI